MKKSAQLLLVALMLTAIVGCSKNPADDVAKAEMAEASGTQQVAAASEAAISAKTAYAIGTDSKINFLASKIVGSEQPGGFEKFVGQLNVADGKLVAEGSKIVIDMHSIWTEAGARLTNHLKNADFFEVEKNPTSTLIATKIEEVDGKQMITGDLNMHGVTKSITFPAEVSVTDQEVTLTAEFHLDRSEFDMGFTGRADNVIRKEVIMTLDVKAKPGEAIFGSL
ncbi:MAG: polyisoprenoid-binding protein YceI [Candidatus Pelagisphaera sp.]|jgi:polyisoprenoid-binding protein YceI